MPFDSLPAVVTDEVTAALQLARSYIEQGWCKGTMAENPSIGQLNYCSIGAIRAATDAAEHQGSRDLFRQAVNRLGLVIDKQSNSQLQWHDQAIVKWNDQKSRTKEQVLAAFDKAIAGRMTKNR